MPPVLSIIGEDKKAMTDLVEALVAELTERGYKVGVVKHHVHDDFEIDIPGKATYRHAKAGARKVAISSPTMFAFISSVDSERNLPDIIDEMFSDMDIVLTEGYKSADTPKLEAKPDIDIRKEAERVVATYVDIQR